MDVGQLCDPHAVVARVQPFDVHLVFGHTRWNEIHHSRDCRMSRSLGNAARWFAGMARTAVGCRMVGFASHAIAWQHEVAWLPRLDLAHPKPVTPAFPARCAAA
jgi:hypothetical protein